MRLRSFLFNIAVSVALSGCAHPSAPARPVSSASRVAAPTLAGDPAHPGQTSGWVDTKLYFGLGPADHPEKGISEAQWRDFLDKEVTPRFPDGLSVVDVYGQWQGHWQGQKDPAPERLRSKLLIVDYQDSPENRNKVEAIRSAWKRQTGDLSVLRVTQPVDVSF
ncbi:MAG TPA: DUF3574 domain-containing protein [Terracidiphilus sp.]|jgi:hypothetical protein